MTIEENDLPPPEQATILGYFNPGYRYPHALVTLIRHADGRIMEVLTNLEKKYIDDLPENYDRKNEFFFKPKNTEVFAYDSHAVALSPEEYFFGTTSEVISYLENRIISEELPLHIECWVTDYIEQLSDIA